MAKRKAARQQTPMGMWFDMTAMAIDASFVIPLRLAKIAAGGAAGTREANGMVTEKMMAANDAVISLMTGGSPDAVMRSYGSKVAANRKRLSKS